MGLFDRFASGLYDRFGRRQPVSAPTPPEPPALDRTTQPAAPAAPSVAEVLRDRMIVAAWDRHEALADARAVEQAVSEGRRYKDLPIISPNQRWDSVTAVRSALQEFVTGQFVAASEIVEQMMADDRINGVVMQRINGLLGLPFSMNATDDDDDKAVEVAEEARKAWPLITDSATLREVWKWGNFLGVGVAEKLYQTGEKWTPRLKFWHPRYLYWRWDTRSYWMHTQTGPVEIKEGDPHWLLYTPFGYYRGWMGGLIRSLAIPWLFRQFGYRDWGRFNEVHGLPIRAILEPAEWGDEDKRKALREVALMASESIVRLPQRQGKGGFDLKLIEAMSQTYDSFKLGMEQANSSIAIVVLGQNLSTEVKGGAYAAAQVHERVAASVIRFDAESLGVTAREQVLVEWAAFNFARPDLAPTPTWDTRPPEDKKAKAEAYEKFAQTIEKLLAEGIPVDVLAMCEEYGIPIRELTDEERKRVGLPAIKEFHVKAGVPSRNEVRERLGLPPAKDGDKPAGQAPPDDQAVERERKRNEDLSREVTRLEIELAASRNLLDIFETSLAAADALPPGVAAGQAYADRLVEEGTPEGAHALAPDREYLLRIIRETPPGRDGKPDVRELRRRLLDAFHHMDPAALARTVARTLVLAQLQGRHAAAEGAKGGKP